MPSSESSLHSYTVYRNNQFWSYNYIRLFPLLKGIRIGKSYKHRSGLQAKTSKFRPKGGIYDLSSMTGWRGARRTGASNAELSNLPSKIFEKSVKIRVWCVCGTSVIYFGTSFFTFPVIFKNFATIAFGTERAGTCGNVGDYNATDPWDFIH